MDHSKGGNNSVGKHPIKMKNTTKNKMLLTKNKAIKNNGAKRTAQGKNLPRKLKRPLSAYNIFFQHEREKIVTNNPSISLEDVLLKMKNTKSQRRSHAGSHGKIGFADLARTVAERWRALDKDKKTLYENEAAAGRARHREAVAASEMLKLGDAVSTVQPESFQRKDLHPSLPLKKTSVQQLYLEQLASETLNYSIQSYENNPINKLSVVPHHQSINERNVTSPQKGFSGSNASTIFSQNSISGENNPQFQPGELFSQQEYLDRIGDATNEYELNEGKMYELQQRRHETHHLLHHSCFPFNQKNVLSVDDLGCDQHLIELENASCFGEEFLKNFTLIDKDFVPTEQLFQDE